MTRKGYFIVGVFVEKVGLKEIVVLSIFLFGLSLGFLGGWLIYSGAAITQGITIAIVGSIIAVSDWAIHFLYRYYLYKLEVKETT